MERDLILAIDQGTTGSKVLAMTPAGAVIAQAYTEVTQHYPAPGWVEHDPVEIWLGVAELIGRVVGEVGPGRIAGVALTNQRETVVVWDRLTGEPLGPAVVWQCRRTSGICRRLKADGLEPLFRERTGLLIDPYFSGPKVAWLLENTPGLRESADQGRAVFGTIDSWLLFNLTGGEVLATDWSNASRTLLFDIRRLRWDPDLFGALGIPLSMAVEARPSSGGFGTTKGVPGLPDGVPIAGAVGDSQGALFGEACVGPGMAKATYGTGTSLMIHSGHECPTPPEGMVATVAWGLGGNGGARAEYALEGIINVTGATLQWLRDGLGILDNAADSAGIAESIEGNDGVYLVPAFVGLGAPHWDMDARGMIHGLTRGTGRAHIIRAALESIAYQVRDVAELAAGAGAAIGSLRVDGAGAGNPFLMRFQADILGVDVRRPGVREVSALGAVFLAGLHLGLIDGVDSIVESWVSERVFTPTMPRAKADALHAGWLDAVGRVLTNRKDA